MSPPPKTPQISLGFPTTGSVMETSQWKNPHLSLVDTIKMLDFPNVTLQECTSWSNVLSPEKRPFQKEHPLPSSIFHGIGWFSEVWNPINSGDFLRQPTPVRLPTAGISPLDPMPDAKSYSDPLRRHRTGTWSNGIESSNPTVDGNQKSGEVSPVEVKVVLPILYMYIPGGGPFLKHQQQVSKAPMVLRWILTPKKYPAIYPRGQWSSGFQRPEYFLK